MGSRGGRTEEGAKDFGTHPGWRARKCWRSCGTGPHRRPNPGRTDPVRRWGRSRRRRGRPPSNGLPCAQHGRSALMRSPQCGKRRPRIGTGRPRIDPTSHSADVTSWARSVARPMSLVSWLADGKHDRSGQAKDLSHLIATSESRVRAYAAAKSVQPPPRLCPGRAGVTRDPRGPVLPTAGAVR